MHLRPASDGMATAPLGGKVISVGNSIENLNTTTITFMSCKYSFSLTKFYDT